MIGLIVATHGKMSDGIVDAAHLIIGSTENIETLNLIHGDDVQVLKEKMLDAIEAVNQNEGVIIFTDLFGASPYNQATLAIHSLPQELKEKIFVLTGVNLPMLLEAISQRMIGSSVEAAVSSIMSEAQQSMVVWPNKEDANVDDDEDDDF
ncbi:PTS sugar transporter subunit IIA [Jeotgalibaca sp. MA1X17-3]|uniref:PTS sugar transporter subunit IIA n=1 Tax=Jeotgalibaca sp. MA1X17-3 TaxID=2908211 RepID=UPI001F404E14|nr:PTS sugar transporter subunit IIA [Jeotgalibaca sp. MA1X17-3]UJF16327.1 PTS sugar transporter subunit IIA [Jeotgalibaca sp. MA1X17-3]